MTKSEIMFLRRKKSFLLLILVASIIFINEVLVYYVQSSRWPPLPQLEGLPHREVRILFVATPQLVGHLNVGPFGLLSRWDSDRYLSKTFNQAYNHVKPRFVVFLGNLLDEGSVASDEKYEEYVERFFTIFQKVSKEKVPMIFVPGESDVGGEGKDKLTAIKVRRFEKYFGNVDGVISDGFLDISKFYDDLDPGTTLVHMKKIFDRRSKNIRVFVNYREILTRRSLEYCTVLHSFLPHLYFSSHGHTSRFRKCFGCHPGRTELNCIPWQIPGVVLTVDLKHLKQWTEIQVPTCSYRMGVQEMGYGVAVINRKTGKMKYTVVWLPHRYVVLYLYLLIACVFLAAYYLYWRFCVYTVQAG